MTLGDYETLAGQIRRFEEAHGGRSRRPREGRRDDRPGDLQAGHQPQAHPDVIEEEAMRRMVRHHGLDEALKCYDNDPTACATFDALMEEAANERGLTIKGWT